MPASDMHRLALVLLVAACGSDPVKQPDASVRPIDAPSIDAPPPDAAVHREGFVLISQGSSSGSATAGVSSQFVDGSVFGTPLGVSGPCLAFNNPPNKGISAGVLTVTGTAMTITATPSGTPPNVGYTNAPTPPKPLFTAGASITLQAAGADFPAFSTTLTAPAAVAGFTAPTTVSRQGYTATWTAGAGPKMWVLIVGTDAAFSTADVMICRVDDTGSFTVPAAAFALLPATDTKTLVALARIDEKVTTVASGTATVGVANQVSSGLVNLTN
jgi:hypothetical protein